MQEADQKKAILNQVNKEIGALKKSGASADTKINEMRDVSKQIKSLDLEIIELEGQIDPLQLAIPNLPHESVPAGGEQNNILLREIGTKPEFKFDPKPHYDLAENLDIVDFKRGAKLSGSGFIIYKKDGAKLERALISYFLDTHVKNNGFEEVSPPFIVNRRAMTGTGQLPKMEEDMYKIPEEDLFLIPTAEVPVTNIYQDEILSGDDLPKKMVAYTPCFRREAGSYGKDTRGMVRIHQFDKVEMVAWVRPDESYPFLETLTGYAEALLVSLGLPYRVLTLAGGDTSFASAKTYDLEVFAAGLGRYLEVSSVSNFEDFQARRARIRYRPQKGGKPELLHTLNGSGLALPRTFIAILENYQNEDGSIRVPDVLISYMGGQTKIG
jgi:seryl-tRNA synthetase